MHREGGGNKKKIKKKRKKEIELLEVGPGRGHFAGGDKRSCSPFIHQSLRLFIYNPQWRAGGRFKWMTDQSP